MKKSILFAAILAVSLSATAQNEIGVINTTDLGITETAKPITAGTILAQTDNVTMSAAYDDNYKTVTVNGPKLSNQSMKYFIADGVQLFSDDTGIQGATNPNDANGGVPSTTLLKPAKGCVYQFDVKTDGTLYIFFKASSNKSYTIFEEGNAVGYTYSQLAESPLPSVYGYTIKGDTEYNYLETSTYPNGVLWPEQIYAGLLTNESSTIALGDNYPLGTTLNDWLTISGDKTKKISKNGCAVIKVNVYEGLKYLFNANGSKASVRGFYFVPGDENVTSQPTITVKNDNGDEETLLVNGGVVDGLRNIKGNVRVNTHKPIYNLNGQQVNGSYKGIVIQNGHKFINR